MTEGETGLRAEAGHGAGPLSIAMIGTRGLPASYGGVERAVEALSLQLVKRGHDVTVYGRTAYCDTGLRNYKGVRHHPLPQVNTKHLEAASHTLLALGDAVASRRYDVIHLHATGPALFAVIPRLLRVPCVATVQGLDWRREKWNRGARMVLRLAARVAATVPHRTIVVSRELERLLAESYGTSPAYVPNGVDLSDLMSESPVEGLQPGKFVLFLGRLVPEKQVHLLIEAFGRLDTDKRLAIAGPSSHTDRYVQEIDRLASRDERVLVLGPRYGAEKAWLLRNADFFVQPSTIEGLPIALLEALACGRYPVVSDIPENVEAVTLDGAPLGLVFRAGDSEDLSAKLRTALGNSREDFDAGQVQRAITSKYDWAEIAARTEAVYDEVLSKRVERRPRFAGL